jgi:hypothetical protein
MGTFLQREREDEDRTAWPGKVGNPCGVVGPADTRHARKEEVAGRSVPRGNTIISLAEMPRFYFVLLLKCPTLNLTGFSL